MNNEKKKKKNRRTEFLSCKSNVLENYTLPSATDVKLHASSMYIYVVEFRDKYFYKPTRNNINDITLEKK